MGVLIECGADVTATVSQLLAFLITLQSAVLQSTTNVTSFDPKTYVDLPLRYNLNVTEAAFLNLPKIQGTNGDEISNETLQKFLGDYFGTPGSELQHHHPLDFNPSPKGFLSKVHNKEVRNWAHEVHRIWLNLSRTIDHNVAAHQDQYTALYLGSPFVVPGSRFREVYYWDSYWVIRGLVVSKMLVTARGMVDNLLSLVESYGFMPNGARKYYLNRSQPPLLSEMVKTVFDATMDESLLKKALPILIREHSFWTSARHTVIIVDGSGKLHSLSRYNANWNTSRPESSTIDVAVAKAVPENERPQLYNDIASTAETGWDFSSRWMGDRHNLSTLRTSRIIPTDLNSYLFQMEKNIAKFAELLGDLKTEELFAGKAEARRAAINTILWNNNTMQWNDYWLPIKPTCTGDGHEEKPVTFNPNSQNSIAYASNYIPLWSGVLSNDLASTEKVGNLLGALETSGLVQKSGIATSLNPTGQQWDYHNGWAPVQHMIIEGLQSTQSISAKNFARNIAISWLRTNFVTFETIGAMVEKYDVSVCGTPGGGGEYTTQSGFGWSNGVVLTLLETYGWPADLSISCS